MLSGELLHNNNMITITIIIIIVIVPKRERKRRNRVLTRYDNKQPPLSPVVNYLPHTPNSPSPLYIVVQEDTWPPHSLSDDEQHKENVPDAQERRREEEECAR